MSKTNSGNGGPRSDETGGASVAHAEIAQSAKAIVRPLRIDFSL